MHPAMTALNTGKEVKDAIMGVYNPAIDEIRWINITAVPQFRNGDSRPFQVYTTFEDITRRKLDEDKIKQQNKRLHAIVTTLPDLIFVVARDGI